MVCERGVSLCAKGRIGKGQRREREERNDKDEGREDEREALLLRVQFFHPNLFHPILCPSPSYFVILFYREPIIDPFGAHDISAKGMAWHGIAWHTRKSEDNKG